MQPKPNKGPAQTCGCRDQSMINVSRMTDSAPRFVCARCGARVSLRAAPQKSAAARARA